MKWCSLSAATSGVASRRCRAPSTRCSTRRAGVRPGSPIYETDPVGGPGGSARTSTRRGRRDHARAAHAAGAAQSVENAFGRVRAERWGPRTLDIDLIVVARPSATTRPHAAASAGARARVRAGAVVEGRPEGALPGHGRWRGCWRGSATRAYACATT
ncbi:2-amino-4-hydroxy-6-hydroxymethyldihydropteridine diphosphokinase [[Actinomadura] parvosata]|uniref:2-amino-4-hydroxy-6- hydroxymethyldihydropteridine diphosphokinase n=1 Tax=[Actinomadura] parvosata TaxID=1955412 RepID=UPI001FE5DB47